MLEHHAIPSRVGAMAIRPWSQIFFWEYDWACILLSGNQFTSYKQPAKEELSGQTNHTQPKQILISPWNMQRLIGHPQQLSMSQDSCWEWDLVETQRLASDHSCHTPFRDNGNEAFIRISTIWQTDAMFRNTKYLFLIEWSLGLKKITSMQRTTTRGVSFHRRRPEERPV
jgi:hypothetical protein